MLYLLQPDSVTDYELVCPRVCVCVCVCACVGVTLNNETSIARKSTSTSHVAPVVSASSHRASLFLRIKQNMSRSVRESVDLGGVTIKRQSCECVLSN